MAEVAVVSGNGMIAIPEDEVDEEMLVALAVAEVSVVRGIAMAVPEDSDDAILVALRVAELSVVRGIGMTAVPEVEAEYEVEVGTVTDGELTEVV